MMLLYGFILVYFMSSANASLGSRVRPSIFFSVVYVEVERFGVFDWIGVNRVD